MFDSSQIFIDSMGANGSIEEQVHRIFEWFSECKKVSSTAIIHRELYKENDC